MIGDVLGKYPAHTVVAQSTGREAAPSASDSANNNENTAEMMALSHDSTTNHNNPTSPENRAQPNDDDVKMQPAKPLLLKKRAATPEQISASEEALGQFVCKECGDVFEHGQALGGHMS